MCDQKSGHKTHYKNGNNNYETIATNLADVREMRRKISEENKVARLQCE